MGVFILKDMPIAFIKEIKTLAITDLHIGYEYELKNKGIKIPFQDEKFLSILKEAREKTKARKIVIVGDIKHEVAKAKKKEIVRIKIFLEKLKEEFEKIVICKGNHDNRIENIVPNGIEVKSSRGFLEKKYGFFHGHAWPFLKLWKAKTWIVGHLQPVIEIYRNGKKNLERVVIKAKLTQLASKYGNIKEVIILPSFNPLIGGMNLTKYQNLEKFILTKILDFQTSFVFLLDGTEIGTLAKILGF